MTTEQVGAEARCAVPPPPFKQPREIDVVRTLPRSTPNTVEKAQLRQLVAPPERDGG